VVSVAGGKVNDTESVVVTAGAPPPDTVAELTGGDVALIATFTVTVIVGYLAPAAKTLSLVQVSVARVQFQFVPPPMAVAVRAAGKVSTTVTVPLVGPAVALLLTTNEYVAPVCPCVKLPVWLLTMLSTGWALMVRARELCAVLPPESRTVQTAV